MMLPVATVLIASQPQASPLAYEGFSMPLPAPFHGGAGFSGPWNHGGSQGLSWSDSTLSISGLRTSGGSVSSDASSLTLSYAWRELPYDVNYNSAIYVSFLVQPRGKLNEGRFGGFFGLVIVGNQALFVGKPGAGAVDEYVLETQGGAGQVASGVSVEIGETALLVVKVDFELNNDVVTLYVNPSVKGSEPAGVTVKSDLDLGPLTSLAIYSGGSFAIDEIRVGTTYEDVVGPVK
jgi:hypothetical protein